MSPLQNYELPKGKDHILCIFFIPCTDEHSRHSINNDNNILLLYGAYSLQSTFTSIFPFNSHNNPVR